MEGISIESLAFGYTESCFSLASDVSVRKEKNNGVKNALEQLSQTIESVISSITTGKEVASEGAGYIENGAYKDGVTDYGEEINQMVLDAESAITDLETLNSQIEAYITALSNYDSYLADMYNAWVEAYDYYKDYILPNGLG